MHLDLPAVLLGKARVHAEDLGGKQRSLVASRAGADFEDDVLLVVGILGQQQELAALLRWRAARGSSAAISSSAMARMSGSVSASMARASARPLPHLLQLAILLHRLFDLAQGLGGFLIFFVVVQHFRQRELRLQLVVALLHLFQAIDHCVFSRSRLKDAYRLLAITV